MVWFSKAAGFQEKASSTKTCGMLSASLRTCPMANPKLLPTLEGSPWAA